MKEGRCLLVGLIGGDDAALPAVALQLHQGGFAVYWEAVGRFLASPGAAAAMEWSAETPEDYRNGLQADGLFWPTWESLPVLETAFGLRGLRGIVFPCLTSVEEAAAIHAARGLVWTVQPAIPTDGEVSLWEDPELLRRELESLLELPEGTFA